MIFADVFAAFRWWLALLGLGAAVLPFTLLLFQKLPDRGYAFTKMVGLLLVSFLFWLMGSLGFVGNNLGGILLALVGVLGLSAWAWRRSQPLPALRSPQFIRHILITELLFAIIFALWVWVRAQNPAIAATEKPMEFAFLNSLGRTPTFPPADPWLSGFAISYYYFGYVMTSVIARLAAVPEPVAFNLALAWLVAGTAVGAFGLVYNLIASQSHRGHRDLRETQGEKSAPSAKSAVSSWGSNNRRRAVLLGLIAALAIPIAGNLEIGLEIAHANGLGSVQFWQWLDVRELNSPAVIVETPRYETSSWWWWRSSRVIHEYTLDGRAEEGLEPIAEFPGFSFILGDLHPHALALPFALLSLMVAFLWYLKAGERKFPLSGLVRDPLFWFTALLLGGMSFLNTWDVLIYSFVTLAAHFLGRWQTQGWDKQLWRETAVLALWLIIPAIILYLPFYLGFRSQAGAPFLLPFLMRPTRLPHFLTIFGMPLSVITIWLAAITVRQRFRGWQNGVKTAVILLLGLLLLMLFLGWVIAASPEGAGRVISLANDLGLALPVRQSGIHFDWGVRAVIILLPTLLGSRLAWPGVILLLTALIALIVTIWSEEATEDTEDTEIEIEPEPELELELELEDEDLQFTPLLLLRVTLSPLPFVLLLIFTGALLTLGPEFVYLRDNFGQRLNTVFKFYYQAWLMFGVAALFALDTLWREFKRVRWAAAAVYAGTFVISLAFPFYAVQSRAAEFRGPVDAVERAPLTLNGLAQVERFNRDEYDAIQWLRENVNGTPTILEAVGGQYSQYGRISSSTGIPTALGWAGHEYQWRGPNTPEPGQRDPAVRDIYGAANWNNTSAWLNSLDVQYIYVGPLELSTYGPQAREKFDGRLDIAYQNNSVTIFRWQPQK